jgi:hypothetical protein
MSSRTVAKVIIPVRTPFLRSPNAWNEAIKTSEPKDKMVAIHPRELQLLRRDGQIYTPFADPASE